MPPGGALFELMSGDECIQTSPTLTDVDKPPCLSMLDDSKWRSWHAELSQVVEQYWNMAIPIAVAFFGFLAVAAVAFSASCRSSISSDMGDACTHCPGPWDLLSRPLHHHWQKRRTRRADPRVVRKAFIFN